VQGLGKQIEDRPLDMAALGSLPFDPGRFHHSRMEKNAAVCSDYGK
jgi:hypothetical protein